MTASLPLRVLVAHDHPYMRAGISRDLTAQGDMLVVAEARDGIETLDFFYKFRPDVSVVGLRMPKLDGIEVVASMVAFHPSTRAIVMAASSGDVHALRALRAGASGYLLQHVIERDLIDTIRSVHRGQIRIPDEVARQLAEHATDSDLTIREIEVLKEISKGRSNKLIGAELDISEQTVKGHTKRILAKLGANDRTHAVTIALQRGFLQREDTWATDQQRCSMSDIRESSPQGDLAQRTSIEFSSQIAATRGLVGRERAAIAGPIDRCWQFLQTTPRFLGARCPAHGDVSIVTVPDGASEDRKYLTISSPERHN